MMDPGIPLNKFRPVFFSFSFLGSVLSSSNFDDQPELHKRAGKSHTISTTLPEVYSMV